MLTSSCITPSPLSLYSVYRDGDVQREKIKAETFGWDLKKKKKCCGQHVFFHPTPPSLALHLHTDFRRLPCLMEDVVTNIALFSFDPMVHVENAQRWLCGLAFKKTTTTTITRCRASPFFFYPLPVCSDRCNWVRVQSMGGSLLNKVNAAPGLCSASVGVQSKLVRATQYNDHSLLYLGKYWMGWNRVTNTTYAQNRKGEEKRRVQQQHHGHWTLDKCTMDHNFFGCLSLCNVLVSPPWHSGTSGQLNCPIGGQWRVLLCRVCLSLFVFFGCFCKGNHVLCCPLVPCSLREDRKVQKIEQRKKGAPRATRAPEQGPHTFLIQKGTNCWHRRERQRATEKESEQKQGKVSRSSFLCFLSSLFQPFTFLSRLVFFFWLH